MPQQSAARQPTSVHDSNAGHDFHVLWATRRVIDLLNPTSTLRAVKMEGVAGEDTASLPGTVDHFLAADLTEYHGGAHFAEANRTIIAQLKYSTRHAADPWTGSRLRKRKGSNSTNSVIERLAAAYQDLLTAGHSRDDIQQKVRIGLISNQPLHPTMQGLWQGAQAALRALGPAPVTLASLLGALPLKHGAELRKLHARVGWVDEQQFTDFWRVLDLRECGTDDRMGQRLALLQELAPSVPTGERDVFLRLTELVRQQALPENQHAAPLEQADVLAQLQVFSKKDLFPEPAALSYPNQPVTTAEAAMIASALLSSGQPRFIAHGAAGVGKTTTVQQIETHLPAGSVVILYDCYADGTYYNLSTGRHTLENALLQLSNELALATGLPFLLAAPVSKYKLLDYFQQRLDAAAKIVAAAGGLLVLVIDAADNSVVKASQEPSATCFVPYLWELNLPANCRLLMTARTHRKASLRAPAQTTELELIGFDLNASVLRLRQVFPAVGAASAAAFHQRTGGNPRVQDYWLDAGTAPAGSYAAFLHSFRRESTTATAIIEDIVKAAVVEVTDPDRAQDQLATLVCLQRPIPLAVFARACGQPLPQAAAFCHALKPGLLLEDDVIGFRDEDFETQLRVRPATAARLTATHERLGEFFLPLAATDVYAAQAVAEHLSAASRHPALIDLVLTGPSVAFIPDSALRLRTERRRLKLALQAAATQGDDLAGAKLAIIAAESLRANAAVQNLVRADVRMAAHFGDVGTVADYFQIGTDDQWLGSVHYQLAAHYAAIPAQRTAAERHLGHARAWVRRYMRLPQHERQHMQIEDLDIACETEACYWLLGPVLAYQQLKRWRPVQVRLRALHKLLGRLAKAVPAAELEAQLRALNLPLLAQCTAQAALWRYGCAVSQDWCSKLAARLLPLLHRKKIKPALENWHYADEITGFAAWPLYLAEVFTHRQLDPEAALLLLADLLPAFPDRSPGSHSTYGEIITPVRVAALQAHLRGEQVTSLDLFPVPPPVKPGEKSAHREDSYQDAEYRKDLDSYLDLYDCRARLLGSPLAVATVEGVIQAGLARLRPARNTSNYSYRHRQAQWLRSAISLLARISGAESLLEQLSSQAQHLAGRYQARQLWLHGAHETLGAPHYRAFAFRCLERAAHDAEEDNLPVNDRWPILLECAQASLPYDEEFSRDFYRRALDAAHQGVGDDVAYRLAVGAEAAAQLGAVLPPEDGHAVGARLAALVEAYQPYISGDDVYAPLDETLAAVTRLHPAAGVALSLRWDVRDVRRLEDGIVPLTEAATVRGYWQPAQSLWLLKLCGEPVDISRIGLGLLDSQLIISAGQRQQVTAPLSALAAWAGREVPLRSRPEALRRILAWAGTHQQAHLPAIRAIQQTVNFVEAATTPTSAGPSQPAELSDYQVAQQAQVKEWKSAARGADVSAFAGWIQTLPFSHEEMVPAILQLAYRVAPAQRTAVLDLLVSVRGSYGSPRDAALDALEKLLTEWRSYGPVQAWAQKGVPRFYARNLHRLTREKSWPPHLEQLCGLPLASPARASVLLPGVAEQLDSLGPEELCRVASALLKTSSVAAATEFTTWLLARIQKQLEADDKVLPFLELLPATNLEVPAPAVLYARLIWAVCGDPDKRVRWRAVHAARQMLILPENEALRNEFVTELVRLSLSTSSLLPKDEEFYWQGARVWVLLLLDRVADELPAVLLTHLAAFKQHAFDPSFPHAQIRELARRILFKLQHHAPAVLAAAEVEHIYFTNRPKGCLTVRGYQAQGAEAFAGVVRTNQFKFDFLDTVEHWFGPLADVFGQTEDKIAALVEHWICEKWGRTAAECEAHRLHDQSRYEWGLTSHYKVDDTTVDNLRMHLTHHALMCVAGELVDRYPMRMEDYTEPTSTWEEWLARYLPSAAPHTWLADWRDPTPLRPECWGRMPQPWRRKPLLHYHEALGLAEPSRPGWLVLFGSHRFGEDEHSGDVYVSSVQVAPEGAQSLLWALQAVKKNDYVFPTFGLSDSDSDVPDDVPAVFTLTPLLEEGASTYEKGVERHDTAARGVHPAYPRLSEDFITRCALTATKDGKEYYDADGRLAAEHEIWEDDSRDTHRARNGDSYSAGHRLWIRWDILQAYLTLTGQDVLFQATLSRSISAKSYSHRQSSYDPGKRRLALLRQDGSFQTVAGYCSPWPAHRPGTGPA